jgi:hypothetical protein
MMRGGFCDLFFLFIFAFVKFQKYNLRYLLGECNYTKLLNLI